MPKSWLSSAGLGPHGRAPISFFAVEPALAVAQDAGAPARELRRLVAGLHAAGLSVICQARAPPQALQRTAFRSACSTCVVNPLCEILLVVPEGDPADMKV